MKEPTCNGCYQNWAGVWWCDNCDEWPCVCPGGSDEPRPTRMVPVEESDDETW